jgi:predicted Zn-ribbon and HTH transcriptional regulator
MEGQKVHMERLEIAIRPPLPKTVEKLRERYRQLKDARAIIDEEIKAILSTHSDMAEARRFHCQRCHYDWTPKIIRISDPKQCPNCHSSYWSRPRQLIRTVKPPKAGGNTWVKKKIIIPDPIEAPAGAALAAALPALLDALMLAPPPPPPLSLKERLAQFASKTDDAMQLVETIKEEKQEAEAIEAINGQE